MDFVHLFNDQNSKISDSSPYVEALWAHLSKKTDYNLETPTLERSIFLQHLPLNLQLFLSDCIQKLEEVIDANSTIHFSVLKIKYLKSFLYWCLLCGEEQGSLVPLTAAKLYLMLSTLSQQQKQNCVFVESIYYAALSAIENTLCSDSIPTEAVLVVDVLREFLKISTLTKDVLTKTVGTLNKIVNLDSQRTFNRFNTGMAFCLV